MARVRGVMAASILVTSMLRVRGSISTNTGDAPASQIASAVAKNVLDTVMTSSPGPIPRATKTSRSASVPELTPTASFWFMVRAATRKPRANLGLAPSWVCFGFVFQGRAIVFNNLLASFVHLTSFLLPLCLRRLVFEVVMLIPLCGRSISQRERCEAEEGDRSLPPRMTGAQPRPSPRDPRRPRASILALSPGDHVSSLAFLLSIVKRLQGQSFLSFPSRQVEI